MSPPRNSLLWPTVAAVGVHALVAFWGFDRTTGSAATEPAATMVVLLASDSDLRVAQGMKIQMAAGEQRQEQAPLRPADLTAGQTKPNDHAEKPSSRGAEQIVVAEEFVRQALETALESPHGGAMRAPYLAGEPLIDLGEGDAAASDGWIELQLSIDEDGRVVEQSIKAMEGLTDQSAAILERTFTGFVYVPASRGGRSVQSEVTLTITVRGGRAAASESR